MKTLQVLCTLGVLLVSQARASVFDDAFWYMRPVDFNANGVMDNGELLNVLKGGIPSDVSNQTPVYGFDANKAFRTTSGCSTRFLSDQTFTSWHLGNDIMGGRYFHGCADLSSTVRGMLPAGSTAFSAVARVYPEDVKNNTRWVFCLGQASTTPTSNSGFSLGFNNNYVRLYPSTKDCNWLTDLPVVANTWIDIGISLEQTTVDVDGVATPTNRVHIICSYPGVGTETKPYLSYTEYTYAKIPGNTYQWVLGSEKLVTGAQSKNYDDNKFFLGEFQQVAMWNRVLSDAEFLEAFRTPEAFGHAQVGLKNGSGDEFGGTAGNATIDLETAAWRTMPRTMAATDVWTLKATLTTEEVASARKLTLRTVDGAATFSATANAGTASTASIDENGTAALFFPRSDLVVGENTIVLRRTDAGGSVTLDALALEEGRQEMVRSYTADAVDAEAVSIPVDIWLTIDVAAGATVSYTGVLSGEGGVRKTGAGTLVLMQTANAYSGGTEVRAGDLKTIEMATSVNQSVFGTGPVTVDATEGGRLVVGTTFANDLVFIGSSSRSRTALHIAAPTVLNGAIAAHGDLHLSTAFADDLSARDVVKGTFNGPVTIDNGFRLAGAPHAVVRFNGLVSADIVEGYWVDNAANVSAALCATRGNLGAFLFAKENSPVAELVIDQTRMLLGCKNALLNTTVTFTGEHLADGVGCLDLRGNSLDYITAVNAPSTLTVDSEGCQVLSASSSPTLTIRGTQRNNLFSAKLDGTVSLSAVGGTAFAFTPRRHTMSGTMQFGRPISMQAGCEFPHLKQIAANNASTLTLWDLEPNALPSLTRLGNGSSFSLKIDPATFTPHQIALELTGWNSGGKCPSSTLYLKNADDVFEVKSLVYKKATENVNVTASQGDYTSADVFSIKQGTVRVFTPVAETIPLTWTGAGEAFGDKANWRDAEGNPLTADPDFTMPKYQLVFDGVTVTVPGDVQTAGIVLKNGATFNGGEGAVLGVWGAGIQVQDAEHAGTDYTFNVPVQINDAVTIAIPTNGTFTAAAGITGTGSIILDGRATEVVGDTLKRTALPVGGRFVLTGNSSIRGDVSVTNAILDVSGTLGVPGDTSTFHLYTSVGSATVPYRYASVNLNGVTCNKKVRVLSLGGTDKNYTYNTSVTYSAGVTNIFNNLVDWGSSHTVLLRKDTTAIFNAGYRAGNSLYFNDSDTGSTMTRVVFNGPLTATSTTKGFVNISGGAGCNTRYVFNAVGGEIGMYLYLAGTGRTIECNVENPFTIKNYFQLGVDASLVLNGTKFTVSDLRTDAKSAIFGTEGAELVVPATGDVTISAKLGGALGVTADGTAKVMIANSTNTANGPLRVTGGRLEIAPTAPWLGTSVEVLGGSLTLNAAVLPNHEAAVFNLGGAGELAVTGGKSLKVAALTLDGVEQTASGLYGPSASSAPHKTVHLTEGYLRLGDSGTYILFR